MSKVKVNADGVSWTEPNPVPNQPPLNLAAYRGEVVEIPSDQVEYLRSVRVRVFYTDPATRVLNGAYREEPSVVDANEAEAATAEAQAQARAKVTDLENQLAEARSSLPLVSSPTGGDSLRPVTLTPDQSGARLIVDDPTELTPAQASAAGLPLPDDGPKRTARPRA